MVIKWESKIGFYCCCLKFVIIGCSALINVRIHEIEQTNGEYLRLLNVSNSDDYDLSGHFLQQNIACTPLCRFPFPYNTIIRAGQTVTVNIDKRNFFIKIKS